MSINTVLSLFCDKGRAFCFIRSPLSMRECCCRKSLKAPPFVAVPSIFTFRSIIGHSLFDIGYSRGSMLDAGDLRFVICGSKLGGQGLLGNRGVLVDFVERVLGILRKYHNKNAKHPISCCFQERNAV